MQSVIRYGSLGINNRPRPPPIRQTIWMEGAGGGRLRATLSQPVEIEFDDMITVSQIWVCPEQGDTICGTDLLKELGGVINPRASSAEWTGGSKQEQPSENRLYR